MAKRVFNFFDEEPTGEVVDGASGVDKVKAKVQAGSFVVPAENANDPALVDVKLTKGEVVVPPASVPAVDAKAKAAGKSGINDLAPNSEMVMARIPVFVDGKPTGEFQMKPVKRPDDLQGTLQETKGNTASQIDGKKTIVAEEQKNTPNAFVDYKAQAERAAQDEPKGYNLGGGVTGDEEEEKKKQEEAAQETYQVQPFQPETIADNPNIKTQDQINQEVKTYVTNPFEQYVKDSEPTIDVEKEKRMKRIAGVNAIGRGLAQIGEVVNAAKGMPVSLNPDRTTFSHQYAQLLDKNRALVDAHRRLMGEGKVKVAAATKAMIDANNKAIADMNTRNTVGERQWNQMEQNNAMQWETRKIAKDRSKIEDDRWNESMKYKKERDEVEDKFKQQQLNIAATNASAYAGRGAHKTKTAGSETFTHPRYGNITMTEEDADAMLKTLSEDTSVSDPLVKKYKANPKSLTATERAKLLSENYERLADDLGISGEFDNPNAQYLRGIEQIENRFAKGDGYYIADYVTDLIKYLTANPIAPMSPEEAASTAKAMTRKAINAKMKNK